MKSPYSNGFNGHKDQPEPDAIDQAVVLLQKFSAGEGLTDTDPDVFDHSDATALLTSGLIAIAEQLRRIADVMETKVI